MHLKPLKKKKMAGHQFLNESWTTQNTLSEVVGIKQTGLKEREAGPKKNPTANTKTLTKVKIQTQSL